MVVVCGIAKNNMRENHVLILFWVNPRNSLDPTMSHCFAEKEGSSHPQLLVCLTLNVLVIFHWRFKLLSLGEVFICYGESMHCIFGRILWLKLNGFNHQINILVLLAKK